jgi:hypothetical protein
MYNRLSYSLQTNITLVPEQCGLGEGVSTENAAFNLTEIKLKSTVLIINAC